jgi:hypothetical protein
MRTEREKRRETYRREKKTERRAEKCVCKFEYCTFFREMHLGVASEKLFLFLSSLMCACCQGTEVK